MFRFCLVVCVSLIFGITAKPFKPVNELTDEAFQDVVMTVDDNGKMNWGVEVEPPEDTDETDYDIDPRMTIWKSMMGSGQDKKPLKAEEDVDELHHPSMADLLRVQVQNTLSASDIEAEPRQEVNMKEAEEDKDDIDHPVFSEVSSEEPEQDWDDVYHKAEELDGYLAPLVAEYKAGAEVHAAHSEPEMDEDELYHGVDLSSLVQVEPLRINVRRAREVRVHLQPEEDMDDLYHKDVLQPVPYRGDAAAAAPVDVPFQRKHTKPEEDLDDLYHQ